MSDMVERVAEAIFRAHFADGEDEALVAEKWSEWPREQDSCRRKARAAIKAMRAPPFKMVATAASETGLRPSLVDLTFNAVIDAALDRAIRAAHRRSTELVEVLDPAPPAKPNDA
jgi:hypothetical protein